MVIFHSYVNIYQRVSFVHEYGNMALHSLSPLCSVFGGPWVDDKTMKTNGYNGWTGTHFTRLLMIFIIWSLVFMIHNGAWFHQHWPWYVAVHHVHHWGHLLPTLQLLRLIRAREPREWMARVFWPADFGWFWPEFWDEWWLGVPSGKQILVA